MGPGMQASSQWDGPRCGPKRGVASIGDGDNGEARSAARGRSGPGHPGAEYLNAAAPELRNVNNAL